MCLLHGSLARSAAENRTEDDIRLLRSRLEFFRTAASGTASQSADAALHAAVGAATHNGLLASLLIQVEAHLDLAAPSHPWGPVEGIEAMEARSLVDHQHLVDAICAGDPQRAEIVAREHFRIDFEMIEAALRKLT